MFSWIDQWDSILNFVILATQATDDQWQGGKAERQGRGIRKKRRRDHDKAGDHPQRSPGSDPTYRLVGDVRRLLPAFAAGPERASTL
jgi:hypothetical protein